MNHNRNVDPLTNNRNADPLTNNRNADPLGTYHCQSGSSMSTGPKRFGEKVEAFEKTKGKL